MGTLRQSAARSLRARTGNGRHAVVTVQVFAGGGAGAGGHGIHVGEPEY